MIRDNQRTGPPGSGRHWLAIILAAGAGRRMGSDLPKPLIPVAGRAMVLRVLDALAQAGINSIVAVIGHESERVRAEIMVNLPPDVTVLFAMQDHQLGTGDATRTGLTLVEQNAGVTDAVIINGDMPLISAETIAELMTTHTTDAAEMTLLTACFENPAGYGRILRGADGGIVRIIEESAASAEQKATGEINAGVYCFRLEVLGGVLAKLRPSGPRKEFYLTDVVNLLVRERKTVSAMPAVRSVEAMGVNDAAQLAACQKIASQEHR